MPLADLNLDVFLVIANMLFIGDILKLRMCCKSLYANTDNISLWLPLLRDILSVIPSHAVSSALFDMSAGALRRTVLEAYRLDKRWKRSETDLERMDLFRCHPLVKDVKILPGGKWFLSVLRDGTLHVGKPHQLDKIGSRGHREPCHVYMEYFGSLERANPGIAVVHKSPYAAARARLASSKLCLYSVDVDTSQIHLLQTVTIEQFVTQYTVSGDRLVFSTRDPSGRRGDFVILVMPVFQHDSRKIRMRVRGLHPYGHSLKVVGSDRLLIAGSDGLRIFEIPPLRLATSPDYNDLVLVVPQWSYVYKELDLERSPPVGPISWDAGGIGHCAISTGTLIHILHITLGKEVCSVEVVSRVVDEYIGCRGLGAVGYRRAVWHAWEGRSVLKTYTIEESLGPGREFLWPGGPEHQRPVPVGSINLPFDTSLDRIRDFSFDEFSGRICVLVNRSNRKGLTSPILFTVDVM